MIISPSPQHAVTPHLPLACANAGRQDKQGAVSTKVNSPVKSRLLYFYTSMTWLCTPQQSGTSRARSSGLASPPNWLNPDLRTPEGSPIGREPPGLSKSEAGPTPPD